MSINNAEVVAYSISNFCARHAISRSLAYTLIRKGLLDVVYYSEGTPRITVEAERRFQERMEAAAEQRRKDAQEGVTRPVGRPVRDMSRADLGTET